MTQTRQGPPRTHRVVEEGEVARRHPGRGSLRPVETRTDPMPVPALVQLNARAERIRTGELDRYRRRLSSLDVDQRCVVEALSLAIMTSLLLRPTEILTDSAGSVRGDRLAEAVRDLFGLAPDHVPVTVPDDRPVYCRPRIEGRVQP